MPELETTHRVGAEISYNNNEANEVIHLSLEPRGFLSALGRSVCLYLKREGRYVVVVEEEARN